jgi:hypothetical protein
MDARRGGHDKYLAASGEDIYSKEYNETLFFTNH